MPIYGIDVSSYNGVIDWVKVKNAGCSHAVLKITKKDLSEDSQFAANIAGCTNKGIPYGVYRYVYEASETAAKKAAKAVVTILKKYNAIPGTIVWWDVEDASIQKKASTTLTPSILAAQSIVEAAGYSFGVYCGLYWYKSVLRTGKLTCPFWIARYPNTNNTPFGTAPDETKRPVIKHALWGWQYSSKGAINGINHATDLNEIYSLPSLSAPAAYPVPVRTLRKGSKGDDVKWLQARLNAYGAHLATDGAFGKLTDSAVRSFQKKKGLTIDGIVGPVTRKALM